MMWFLAGLLVLSLFGLSIPTVDTNDYIANVILAVTATASVWMMINERQR